MLGEFLGARDGTIAETGGIVVAHRLLIISIIVIDRTYLLDGVARLIELAEDIHQILGNGLVADQFPLVHFSLGIHMEHLDMAQVTTRHSTTLRIGFPLHPGKERVADRSHREVLRLHHECRH